MSYVVDGCNVVATEHTRYGLIHICRNCRVHEQCWVCMLWNYITAGHGRYGCLLCGGLRSEQCYVHSVGVDRVNVSSQVAYFSSALICVHTLLE